jgi:23S rRNA pseudouridine1911/1915/1917 synthase
VDLQRLLAPEEEIAFRVESSEHGQRLDRLLAKRLPFASRTRIAGWIRAGRARVDGVAAQRASLHAQRGQEVALTIVKAARDTASPIDDLLALPELARGDGWIALEKPANVACHPAGNEIKRTFLGALTLRYADEAEPGGPWLPHRLDRATSGLMLVALSRAAQARISAAFARGEVRRFYDARVRGDASDRLPRDGTALDLDLPLVRCGDAPPRFRVGREGVPSHSRARLLRADASSSEVELEPVTGRQHQLRVHLAHLGHPIAGDPIYDPEVQPGGRMCLHARRLGFPAGSIGNPEAIQLETAAPRFATASARSIR